MATRYYNPPAKGATPWPPDHHWDPCSQGHSDEDYIDEWGEKCCVRCGRPSWRWRI